MSGFGDHQGEESGDAVGRDGIAIIGMSCLFPGAPGVDAYWRNILGGVEAITDPPPEAWDPGLYYDPDSTETDRVYCKRGGYLGALASFEPLAHGIPPVAVGGEPDQWLALRVACEALADAGLEPLDESVRRRTAVILGKGTYLNGGNALAVQHGLIVTQTLEVLRSLHPEYTEMELEAIRRGLKAGLPEMGPEMVAGLIPNIIVGRIANRLNLMGPAYTVDAACASSLVAVQLALRDLRDGECDLALVGGSQVWMPVPTLGIFCQLGALSRRQQIRPFDEGADGTLLGEGIGMLVLKRVGDAERDGDRIYAVIRGVGVASDGRGAGVMAPRVEGEVLALERAYRDAGVSPRDIGLIEAHGTGTPVGDVTEVRALTRVFGGRQGRLPRCAIGSVKSMIAHTMPAAGAAGLIKVALALHHKVLPPTLNCDRPNPKLELEKTPFYINTTVRPWVHGGDGPRRGAVNAFGFGGINSHAVLEEYRPGRGSGRTSVAVAGDPPARALPDHSIAWDIEVCLFEAESPSRLLEEVGRWARILDAIGSAPTSAGEATGPHDLTDVAYSLSRERLGPGERTACRLAVVASSLADLRQKLSRAAGRLADPGCRRIRDVSGIYFAAEPLKREGGLAFLIPGEGAQYPNMLADLFLHLPEVRDRYDRFDRLFRGLGHEHLPSDYIFPRPSLAPSEREGVDALLWRIEGAMASVWVANLALFAVLERLAIRPDVIVGHSSGEYAALAVTGMVDVESDERFAQVMRQLMQVHEQAFGEWTPRATLLALAAGREQAEAIAREAGGEVFVAMDNCPHQVVLACGGDAAERVLEIVRSRGIIGETLRFDRPYHTPLFAPYLEKLRGLLDRLELSRPRVPLYSCTTAGPFPVDPGGIRSVLVEHWARPVQFRRTIETLYDEGIRLFVEAGPRGNLTAFVEDTLRGRRFCAVPANVQRRSGIAQLNHLVGILAAEGVDVDVSSLYRSRQPRLIGTGEAIDLTSPSRPAVRVKLGTGLPPMRLPEAIIRQLRDAAAPHSAGPDESSQPGGTRADGEVGCRPEGDDATARPPSDDAIPAGAGEPAGAAPSSPSTGIDLAALPHRDDADATGDVPIAQAIGDFLQTMEQFLIVEGQVMRDCLGPTILSTDPPGPVVPEGSHLLARGREAPGPTYPLLGDVISWRDGEELVARRRFDASEDLYLQDHALGRSISDDDPDLRGLIVMPLTMSLEILAEAASRLVPGRTVVGLRDVRAHRWIAFEDGPQVLQVTASRRPEDDDRVVVRLHNLTEEERADGPAPGPAIEATVILADTYPPPDPPRAPTPEEGRPSRLRPDRLYTEAMFHGARWQGVASIDRTDPRGTVATLRVLPIDAFFRSDPGPRFVLDPAVLDAAGQVIGFWTTEHLARGRVIFPYRLDALEIHAPNQPAGGLVSCAASIELIGEHQVRSEIAVDGADGRPWMRLIGWWDKRFDLPGRLAPLIMPSRWEDVSEAWPEPTTSLPGPEFLSCRRIAIGPLPDRSFWEPVWAHRILGRKERGWYGRPRTPDGRRLGWLAGRTAAKEAVRELLRVHEGLDLQLADIEIHPGTSAPFRVDGAWRDAVGRLPVVSIAEAEGLAVALAGLPPDADDDRLLPGIAIEDRRVRARGPIEPSPGGEEGRLLQRMAPESGAEWILRWWCAREAVSRALGGGPADGPRTVSVVAADPVTGLVCVRLGGRLAAAYPDLAVAPLAVHTGRHGDIVVAATLCRSVGAAWSQPEIHTAAWSGRA